MKVNQTDDGIQIYYTCPAEARYHSDYDGIMAHYTAILNEKGSTPWMWIFDCSGFSMEHARNIRVARGLAQLINSRPGLRKIMIVNPTWHIHITLCFVRPFLSEHVRSLIFISEEPFRLKK